MAMVGTLKNVAISTVFVLAGSMFPLALVDWVHEMTGSSMAYYLAVPGMIVTWWMANIVDRSIMRPASPA